MKYGRKLLYGVEYGMEMEWKKILVWNGIWNGNGMEENCRNEIWKNCLPFHTMPCLQPTNYFLAFQSEDEQTLLLLVWVNCNILSIFGIYLERRFKIFEVRHKQQKYFIP